MWEVGMLMLTTSRGTEWINTVIVLDKAEPGYKNKLKTAPGVHVAGVSTPDGGKTWKYGTVSVPNHKFG